MKQNQRILVVDDEQDLLEILKFNLETEGYEVQTATSAEEAQTLDIASFDLLLLDVMMGGMSGFALARLLKDDPKTASVPIIFLTARDTENDTVTGFNLGADDYISKPFSLREVMVRVRAVLRRTAVDNGEEEPHLITYQGIVMNLDKKTVTIDGEEIAFTKTEFELLAPAARRARTRVLSPGAYRPRVAEGCARARPHGGRKHHTSAQEDRTFCEVHRHTPRFRLLLRCLGGWV